MTNEEKKAIEKLKNTSEQCHNSKECWENEDCTDCYVEVEDIMAIDTVLKLLEGWKIELEKKDNRIKELESDNYECNNRISDYIETINKIREEFLKYDWKNSNNEQIYNQLKSLYNEIFKNKAKESGDENDK